MLQRFIQTKRSVSALVCMLLVTGFLGGCAAPARVDQMQVNSSMANRVAVGASPMKEAVSIQDVTGGKETNPMWVSNVSSSDFERALEASLKDAGLWSANRQASKYMLIANLAKLDQPLVGASMTVIATVHYTLVDRATKRDVMDRMIALPYTAEWNAAFMGSERLKLANEGAIRTNIQALIDALIAFKPAAGQVQLSQ